MKKTVLSKRIAKELNRSYADSFFDMSGKKVLARGKTGTVQQFSAGFFLRTQGSIVCLRKKDGTRIAYV